MLRLRIVSEYAHVGYSLRTASAAVNGSVDRITPRIIQMLIQIAVHDIVANTNNPHIDWSCSALNRSRQHTPYKGFLNGDKKQYDRNHRNHHSGQKRSVINLQGVSEIHESRRNGLIGR